ncbi:MAG: phosphonate monoester hydrolase, partial [Pseudomonadota bacterium]
EVPKWRSHVFSEYDFSVQPVAPRLGLEPREARLFMVFDGRYKMMHCAAQGMRPMLFDLQEDPGELNDLVRTQPDHPALGPLYEALNAWGLRMSQRVTKSEDDIKAMRGQTNRKGVLIHLVDGTEVPDEWTVKYRGPAGADYTS